jgi:nitrogen fixation protein FixH
MSSDMSRKRPPGWWYPWIFVGLFGIVFAVNMTMMKFATSTFSGLAVEHAFEKGNAYNAEIAAERAQTALGWTGTLAVVATEPEDEDARTVRWRFTLTDADKAPIDGLRITAEIDRPTLTGHDIAMTLDPVAPGTYEAETLLPFKGQWDVRLIANQADDPKFRLRQRVEIP